MNDAQAISLGIDIGSTTAKIVIVQNKKIVYSRYERHFSMVRSKLISMLQDAQPYLENGSFTVAISGSAGMGLAEAASIAFVQEVHATSQIVKLLLPDTNVVIELGGEDAKVIFFDHGIDERMNGSCAGGTGAFIDQMAVLLDMSVDEMDELSLTHSRIYPIASRCGVFAKTDIQPLLNQGANKADVAASIYQAVVNQTIAGLAQGRRIAGKVLFLGGPLHYCRGLRERFTETLNLKPEDAVFPEYGIFAVALGAALYGEKSSAQQTYTEFMNKLYAVERASSTNTSILPPLFKDSSEYERFSARHAEASVSEYDINDYSGKAYLGIDCGSTTTKLVLISDDRKLLYKYYSSNKGAPVEIVRQQLSVLSDICDRRGITICGSTVTGYGEELIKNAFHIDAGIVETIAHYTAAKYFRPDVDFILDIGGQDIKCFKIKNGAIDSIMLNEACSSGCGSFIETFATSMGYGVSEFARKGLFAKAPVNLGTRCTVFMNSSVKQSQKDGATTEDISAGLSVSVVKNALYKVIRATSPNQLGKHVVVQGGTFYNDAVLRAFENELGQEVIRPNIAGLMGAYGAALYSMRFNKSAMLSHKELQSFTHTSESAICNGCTNHCRLTINKFANGERYISGNRCDRGNGSTGNASIPNLYKYKLKLLTSLTQSNAPSTRSIRMGIPLALGIYELLPLWNGIFSTLGFDVVISAPSTRRTYERGQFSIPSDTVCYPAKLMHGHIDELLTKGVDYIFYPCLSYNVDDNAGDNHYNCPVVAYYSELLNANVDDLVNTRFLYPYLNINDKTVLAKGIYDCLKPYISISLNDVVRAVKKGFDQYNKHICAVRKEGEAAIEYARANNMRIMILAGRPYHIDPEVCHGIDELAQSLGFVVVSEDSVCHLVSPSPVKVLNQWTYHSRLYRAAKYATKNRDTELVQLVSFGCGIDAITTDEVRSILESAGKHYTQIKIDEITNLGAVKIRLRSLLGALENND